MSMNFGQILDAICEDGIDPSRRSDAENWVNFRHAWIWGAADWTFKYAQAPITFTNGQQIIAANDMPTNLHAVYAIYDAHGEPLRAFRDVRQFFDRYNTLAIPITTAYPEAYSVINGQIYVGPVGDGSTGIIVYQKERTPLVNDTDPTGLPDGFDLALVHGGKAEGFKMTNIPLASNFDADFTAAVTAMENDWLDQTLETGEQSGAYRPGSGYPEAW